MVCGGGRRAGNLDPLRIAQELVDETRDLGRHGGREEQSLAPRRQQLADLLDVGDEAHVQHAVGFVDDENFDAHQHQASALKVIQHSAGSGDQNIDAAVELLDLFVHRDAADEQRYVELVIDAVLLEALGHLGGKLACRRQNERARHPRSGSAGFEPGDHGQNERGGLARAGLRYSENISPCDGDRNGGGLDGRW